jgi:membrane fusion protein, multidrug efflux system
MHVRRVVLLLSPLALAAVLAACGPATGANAPGAGGPPPAPVTVLKVTAADLPTAYEYVGQTAGSRDVEVRARVDGILMKRNFTEGAPVRRGQSLYTLDPAPFQAVLNRADADVAAAEARAAQASRNMARLKPLGEAKAISQKEYDDAVSAEQIARAELKAAQARRAEARLNLDYTRVEAPIGGVASRSQVSEGTLVSGPQVLLTTVMQTDPIKVRFGISENDTLRWKQEVAAGGLKLPARDAFEVQLKLADGSIYPLKGRMSFSDTRVSGSTGTVEAEAEIPNPDGVLKPGQFVRVRLLGATRPNAVKVPTRAVLEGPQGKFVYLATDGKALPKPVQVGDQVGDGWIVAGLNAGDPVIVDGMARIFFPGAPVQLAPTEGAAAPAAAAAPAKPASAAK